MKNFHRITRILTIGEFAFVPFFIASLGFVFISLSLGLSNFSVVKREPLIANIATAVANGADLTVVRHIYKQRKQERSGIFAALLRGNQENYRSDEYYPADTPLSDILQDIRAAQFVRKPTDNQVLQAQLEKLIHELEQTSPFDKLEPGQREAFDNIRGKLAANYDPVQNDLTRLVDELHAKNIAVEKYLRDSTFNLWLSFFALFLSLVISSYQIFMGREKRMMELFRRAVSSEQERIKHAAHEA